MAEQLLRLRNDQEAQALFGKHDQHLRNIEQALGVSVVVRGEEIKVSGSDEAVTKSLKLFEDLLVVVRSGAPLRKDDVDYALRALQDTRLVQLRQVYQERIEVPSKRRFVIPRTPGQKSYVDAMRSHDIVFGIGPAGTGKCIASSTLVLTNRGLLPIESFAGDTRAGHDRPIDLGIAGLCKTEPASHIYNGGHSRTKRIRTRFGFEIEVTPEHPLLKLEASGQQVWTHAAQLCLGDYVAIQRGQRLFGRQTQTDFQYHPNGKHDHAKPITMTRLDEEFAYFLGLLTGAGCLTFKNRVIVSSADREIIEAFQGIADRFNLRMFRNGAKRPYDRIIASSPLYQLLLSLGMSNGTAATKRIPHAILKAPEPIVIAFLQGLFDTDGTVSRRDGHAQLCSISKRLLDEVQLLLLNLGMLSNKRPKWTWHQDERRLSYELELTGSDADQFYKRVGFRLNRKQRLQLQRARNPNVDLLPHVNRVIHAAISAGTFSHQMHKALDDYKTGRRKPSYATLGKTVASNRLSELHDQCFFWADIQDIQDGEADVYDLTVPGSHAFCANGFVNHNTYLGMAMAVENLIKGEVSRIILTRPAVEAGERLGYLPGDLSEKINPYLRPLYDALYEMMEVDMIQRYIDRGIIEVAPLAYMRGRAQPYFSSVLTPRGYVPIGSLQVGDTVVGADGAPTCIAGVYPQGRKEIFRVTMQDGASTLCCADHLWAVYTRDDRRRNKGFRVLETREISERLRCAHYHRFELPLISAPVQFPLRPVSMNPYALGVLLGDGCLIGEALEGVQVARKSNIDYVLRNANGGRGGVIVANPVTMVLRDLEFCGPRSSTKCVPQAYLYNSTEVRLAVLQGLLDTDGGPVTQAGRTCRIHYSTTSARLRDDVIFLVRSLGGIAYSRTRVAAGRAPGRAKGRAVRHVSDSYTLDLRLPETLQPFRVLRKLQRYQQTGGGHPARYIDHIERVGEHEAVCIRVDAPDSLYVTDDFIVTHNTLNDSFIILDEAQNTTSEQMKMFLTRLGFDSKAVVTGDITQIDLPTDKASGLVQVQTLLANIPGIKFALFSGQDVVRHELVQAIIQAYERMNHHPA